MSRFTDDLVSRPANVEGPPPLFVTSLLMELGKTNAMRAEQEAAIAAWLASHKPNASLVEDLRDEGFGHLLGSRLRA